ncbi:MAG TPA: HD domain-containing protein [Sphingomicrobium sp.]|nr:HD domain-containing protein [Sphingomicrobium sp.]
MVDQLNWDNAEGVTNNGEYDFAAPYDGPDDTAEADLIDALLETLAFKRLGDVRFLGALDYFLVSQPNGSSRNKRFTRLQHSLGVAALAKAYLDLKQVHTPQQRLLCVAAAMLHDIGHPPFSHTLEPVFEEAFGINHHGASERIITGLVPLGSEIVEILRSFGIDPLAVLHLLNGGDELFDHFFSGPINFDTIEGILRARNYLRMQKLGLTPMKVMKAAVSRSSPESRHIVDGFWHSKQEVYAVVVRSKSGVFYDALFQAIVRSHINALTLADYFATEAEIFRKIPLLRDVLKKDKVAEIARAVLPAEVAYYLRQFYIDDGGTFHSGEDNKRYRQKKALGSLTLGDIL